MPDREAWLRLCEQAAIEQDPQRLLDLVREINHLLELKIERLNNLRSSTFPRA